MATHDYSLANQSGSSFRTDLNNCLAAIQSNNSGASAPSSTVAFMLWADSNTGILKIRNAANDDWVGLFQLDGTLTLEDGSASNPGLAFRDDLNTGVFSSGADAFNIATGGSNRVLVNSTGLTVTGTAIANTFQGVDNAKLQLGTSQDLQIYHDSNDSFIDDAGVGSLKIRASTVQIENAPSGGEVVAKFIGDGACELYHNGGNKKLSTTSGGVKIESGGAVELVVQAGEDGAATLRLAEDEGDDFTDESRVIQNAGVLHLQNLVSSGTWENMATFAGNGAVNLFFNNALKFETNTNGCLLSDNVKLQLGGGADLQIYHDASNSYVHDTGTGGLRLRGNEINAVNEANSEWIWRAFESGAVELYHSGTKHFETASTGAICVFDSSDTSMPPDRFFEVRNSNTSASIFAMSKYCATTDSSAGGSWWYVGAERHGSGTGAQFGIWRKDNRLLYGKENGYTSVSNSFSAHTRMEDAYHTLHSTASTATVVIENSNGSSPYGMLIDFSAASPDNNSVYFIKAEDGGNTNRFTVWSDGDVDNHDNAYGSLSDIKLKENIVDAGSQWADVKAVKVRNFNFKDNKSKELLGVVAQELETVCPKLVVERKDIDDKFEETGTTTKSVKYSILYMKAFKALQEAMAKIETLETKVAALESA